MSRGEKCPACKKWTLKNWSDDPEHPDAVKICTTCGAQRLLFTDGTYRCFGFTEEQYQGRNEK